MAEDFDPSSPSPSEADPADLRGALVQLVAEAESYYGVGRAGVNRALAALPVARAQLAALERLLAELNDDGITDASLAAARAALAAVPAEGP